jgi:hypothetical protein
MMNRWTHNLFLLPIVFSPLHDITIYQWHELVACIFVVQKSFEEAMESIEKVKTGKGDM